MRDVFRRVRPLLDQVQVLASGLEPVGEGGDAPEEPSPEIVARRSRLEDLSKEIRDHVQELVDLGIEVKSIDGLVDFRSRHRGREVYLCWRWDETEVAWFHDVDAGFTGRQPIEDPADFVGDERH